MKLRFDYTSDGYIEAIRYLKSIGRASDAERGFSSDGYSIVQLANDIYYKNNNCENCVLNDKCNCKND